MTNLSTRLKNRDTKLSETPKISTFGEIPKKVELLELERKLSSFFPRVTKIPEIQEHLIFTSEMLFCKFLSDLIFEAKSLGFSIITFGSFGVRRRATA